MAASFGISTAKSGRVVTRITGTSWTELLSQRLQADGKIVIAGTTNFTAAWDPDESQWNDEARFMPTLWRFNADGSPDVTFGVGGFSFIDVPGEINIDVEATDLHIQSDGSSLVPLIYYQGTIGSGSAAKDGLAKFTPTGLLDPAFGTNGVYYRDRLQIGYTDVSRVRTQSTGRIILTSQVMVPQKWFVVYGITAAGALDGSFAAASGAGAGIYVLAGDTDITLYNVLVLPDDKIILQGIDGAFGEAQKFMLVRLNADGTIDTGWGTSGITYVDFPFHKDAFAFAGLLRQSDGKIVAGGWAAYDSSNHTAVALCRLNTDGTLDTTFGVDNGMTYAHAGSRVNDQSFGGSMFYDADGKIVIGGMTCSAGSSYHVATETFFIARYSAEGVPDASFGTSGYRDVDVDGTTNQDVYSGALTSEGKYLFCGHGNGAENHGAGHTGGGAWGWMIRTDNAGALDTSFGQLSSFAYGAAPEVTTDAASAVAATTTTANATVDPNGSPTYWRFVYGKTSGRYAYRSAAALVGAGSSGVGVTASLTGLTSGTAYYGRAIAYSGKGGHTVGAEVTWTTS